MASNEKFFDEVKEQSLVKATIVEQYFSAWAKIIIGSQKSRPQHAQKIGYIDLFAGPGRYKDGSISTPLRILNRAIEDADLCERLVTILNDKNEDHSNSLSEAISALSNISRLKHPPTVWNEEIGDNIAAKFSSINKIPLLAFIDPWGYKGLSLRLVDAFLKDWGCECIFFFNYQRINAGLSNPMVRAHMEALFGDNAEPLSQTLSTLNPREREVAIVEALAQALKKFGHRYVLPFCFKDANGVRTTHHLIFVSKGFKGYEVMKSVMAKQSSSESQGVPSFQYCPSESMRQGLLFELGRPLDDLEGLLLEEFKGRRMTMREVYMEHCVDTPYISTNYKTILKRMEDAGTIQTFGRKSPRGFADYVSIQFPS